MIIGAKKIFYENLSSTNSFAASLLKRENLQEGTVIRAGFQSSGRGQSGNSWESQAGKNLLFSIILYPVTVKAERQFILSQAISLGIKDFLSDYINNVSVKWPNDIYAGDDKIAGILIENSIIRDEIESTIAGIGININQERFYGDAPNPVSLRNITGREHDLDECLASVLERIDKMYRMVLQKKTRYIEDEYIISLYRLGQWAEYSDSNGIFDGRINSVTGSGRLLIEDRRGRIYEYGFKEVDFL